MDPVEVEPILKTIFKIASRWKALLLLDEADEFLAQRSENVQLMLCTNRHRNIRQATGTPTLQA